MGLASLHADARLTSPSEQLIELLDNDLTALVGVARDVPAAPVVVESLAAFDHFFGAEPTLLRESAAGFFRNGGRRAVIAAFLRQPGWSDEDAVRRALAALESNPDIGLVCAPGLSSSHFHDLLLAHAERCRFRLAVLDPPPGTKNDPRQVPRPRDSPFGAYFYPWLTATDAEGVRTVPPSGHVAGYLVRLGRERIATNPPANDVLRGASGTSLLLSPSDEEYLSRRGINCIRALGERGVRVTGARTTAGDPRWPHIGARRLQLRVERSLERATRWMEQEENGEALWQRTTARISGFLTRLVEAGVLPSQGVVHCDRRSQPAGLIAVGGCAIDVALPLGPNGEPVSIRIVQKTASAR